MSYPTSLSDISWNFIAPFFEHSFAIKKYRKHSLREIVDACLYICDNGTKWRNLPNDFPPWKTVYHYYRLWSQSGLWEKINLVLVESVRFASGREESPSLASLDSQSQSAEPGVLERGLDGNKKVNGRKRHIAVDCNGLLLCVLCTAANVSDRYPGEELIEVLNDENRFPRMKKVLGDKAYEHVGSQQAIPVTVEASIRKPGTKGFVPEAFRWAVERTFAWLNRQRRLTRNYEKSIKHQESMNYIGSIAICLKRLAKWMRS